MALTKIGMRNAWFQVHKWIGLILAIAIIPISITGAALVWHDGLDEWLNPQRVSGASAALPAPAYADAARSHIGANERLASLEIPEEGAVVAGAARPPQPGGGRPVRTMVWLNPADAALLDSAASDAGVIRFMHVLHGSLFIPEWGRPIVGWVGVAMLFSCISGIWLWWPTVGSWLRGLRWKRHRNFDTNLHHLFGFWIALPLFVLSVTGVWISFPKVFEVFNAESSEQRGGPGGPGGEAKGKGGDRAERKGGERAKGNGGPGGPGGGGGPSREQRMRAQPLVDPAIDLPRALAVAAEASPGRVARIGFPTDVEPVWTIATGSDERDTQTEIKVDAATGTAEVKPPRDEPETLSRLMRRIHDGTDMGLFWQIIVFLGGLLPAILGITGIIMWWRARGWRGELEARQKRAKARA